MAEGGWVALGTGIGLIGSFATTWLTDWLQHRRLDRIDQARKRLLLRMLNDERFQWRKLDTLAHVIGADRPTTTRLLLEVEARGAEEGSDVWGLISQNPLPSE